MALHKMRVKIKDIQLHHVDIVDKKNIRCSLACSLSAAGTNGGLLLRGTVTTPNHNKIIV
jgi:hypothetical protein